MPSNNYTQNLHMISATETPLELLEFQDSTMAQPQRLVKDNQPVISNGNLYTPCGFYFQYPDSGEKTQPKASIIIDNISNELCDLIDQRFGANDMQITIIQIMRETPDIIEFKHKFKKIGAININKQAISFDLEYLDVINANAINFIYDKKNSEGIF